MTYEDKPRGQLLLFGSNFMSLQSKCFISTEESKNIERGKSTEGDKSAEESKIASWIGILITYEDKPRGQLKFPKNGIIKHCSEYMIQWKKCNKKLAFFLVLG